MGEKTARAGIYIRVSTDEQAQGYGLDVQRERCRAAAVARGWMVVGEYADEGISGTLDERERPGLSCMLAAAEAGEIDAVIVLALDRLARNARLILRLTDQLREAGAEFVSVKEAIDTSTPAGRLFRTMLAGMAEFERDVIVERTVAGRDRRGRIDGERGGRVPFGYVRTAQGIEIVEHEAEQVRHIFTARAQGATLREIAVAMNESGHPSPRGGRWHPSSVAQVLMNATAYSGARRGASDVRWPAILSSRQARRVASIDRRRAA